jgi:hypothetical protein
MLATVRTGMPAVELSISLSTKTGHPWHRAGKFSSGGYLTSVANAGLRSLPFLESLP